MRDGNYAWNIETTCSFCLIRKEKAGNAYHKEGGRTATFVIWATGLSKNNTYDESKVGSVKEMCIANSCTGGAGPSCPAWSGWLGKGLSIDLKRAINDILRPYITKEAERLDFTIIGTSIAPSVAPSVAPLFDIDPEYDEVEQSIKRLPKSPKGLSKKQGLVKKQKK